MGLGQFGVQLFFVVSAFTLCMSFERRSGERNSVSAFYIRRFFRIAPLYYMGIAIYFVVRYLDSQYSATALFGVGSYTLKNIMANVFFVHGFVPDANNTIVPGGWSIGTEMAFYLIFPMLFPVVKKVVKHRDIKFLALLLISVLLVNLILEREVLSRIFNTQFVNNGFLYFNIINQLPVFLVGMGAYFYFKDNRGDISNLHLAIVSAVVGTLLVGCWFWVSESAGTFTPGLSAVLFASLIELMSRIGSHKAVIGKIGRLSFSMYIFHFVFAWNVVPLFFSRFLSDINPLFKFLVSYVLVVLFTYLIAVITERLIERQGIGLGSKLIKKLQGAPQTYSV
ncbi:acyltransferase family protein [Pseudomonas fluorescens]|uniref:Acyltransferase family protein n=2 Tax=Pseudomonas fluorescens TaxID=294 RepID=A0A0P8WP74_PSEFL|nr:acyltransferase family protein [Pseudomonas fluorescens]